MIDLKILTIRDLLPIKNVEYAQSVSPLSLLITGDDFSGASHVYINDIESPEFAILATGRILAQVPANQVKSNLRKVAVIADIPSTTRSSLLHFEVGSSLRSIKGLEKLVQAFCKLLLQSPGTDRFRPTEGGGLLKLLGRNVSRGDSSSLQASVVGCVTRTRDQMVSRQAVDRRIPSDEKLLSATTDGVGFDPSTTTLSARIFLSAVSGKLAVANLTL